jgi:hypothetical protein
VNTTEAVAALIEALNESAIPYMIVGSLSSNLYGIPRSTKDADFVIQLGATPLSTLLQKLPKELKAEQQIGFETITGTTRYRINLADSEFMIELFELSDDPHDLLRFKNRQHSTYAGKPISVPRAEDVIITKLRWSKAGKRTKDIDDVRNILAVQKGKLDLAYLRDWCSQHNTLELLDNLLAET